MSITRSLIAPFSFLFFPFFFAIIPFILTSWNCAGKQADYRHGLIDNWINEYWINVHGLIRYQEISLKTLAMVKDEKWLLIEARREV